MALTEREYDLEREAERLSEEMNEYAQEQADAPVGSDAAQQAAQMGQRAQRLRSGLSWAVEEYGAETVTVGALTNGERNRVLDTVEQTGWKRRDCYVAAGCVDAPWVKHDADAVTQDAYEDTVLNVVDLHPALVDWLEEQITALSRVGADEGNAYRQLVLEKRIQATSENGNG